MQKLEEILKAEEAARHTVATAKERAKATVAQAEADAKALSENTRKETASEAARMREQMLQEAREQAAGLTEGGPRDIEEARSRIDLAVDRALSALLE